MANIVLRNLEKTTHIQKTVAEGYLYKDLSFDLDPNFTNSGEFEKKTDQKDLKPIYNKNAVVTALVNLFTTSPGEKLLNPTFGMDLRDILFDPISETRAFILGNRIYDNITTQEPRVIVRNVSVTGVVDTQEYIIDLELSIPSLQEYGLSLVGVLNNDGFVVTNGN